MKDGKAPTSSSYRESLINSLKNSEHAAALHCGNVGIR